MPAARETAARAISTDRRARQACPRKTAAPAAKCRRIPPARGVSPASLTFETGAAPVSGGPDAADRACAAAVSATEAPAS
jgi:hypothetical protein